MKITLIGDIAFTNIISEQESLNHRRYKEILPYFNDSTIVFANLEVPIKGDESKNENKDIIYFSNSEPTKTLLRKFNVGCVSLANNHIYDCKLSGLKATIGLLNELGIKHTGAGWLKEHCEPVIIHASSKKIGFLAYVDKSTNPKTETFTELFINYFEKDRVIEDIKSIRNRVDTIICSIHWGNDYSYYPTSTQVSVARELVDAGADIIMGHHPHTLQPFEIYNGGAIFYSLGGITFGDYMRNGKMHALPKKTKTGMVCKYNLNTKELCFKATKELKGNFVVPSSLNYTKWSNKKWRNYRLKESNAICRVFIDLNDKVLYRIYEYFFGFYQNPLRRLFQLSNLKKLRKLFNLYRTHNK